MSTTGNPRNGPESGPVQNRIYPPPEALCRQLRPRLPVLRDMYFRLVIASTQGDASQRFPQYAHALSLLRQRVPLILLFAMFASSALTREQYPPPSPVPLSNEGAAWAQKTLKTFSVEEKVGQLFMIRLRVEFMNGQSPDYLQLRNNIRKYHIG